MLNLDTGVISITGIAVNNLSPTRDARLHDVAINIERNFLFKLIHKGALFWPRPDKAHITFQDVEELREFIQASLTDKPANSSNTRVIGLRELCTILF